MGEKTLYMIGNSHIDPVWFWDWEEGMQEVKATFASAIERMDEYPDMKFTATSSAFFEWIEEIAPELFEKIRQRVREGRWELTGGWFIEPDCILPCGEAFVRQGLYAQRFFMEKFGVRCRIGSNVDSFGHNPMLPQILKKSGMDAYVFMRPRLDTAVFRWESPDGSQVDVISLPSEYTTWFYDSTKEAIEMAKKAAERSNLAGMPCCYGVGNHGGGPTRENIQAIYKLRKVLPDCELQFGTYREFLNSLTEEERRCLPIRQDFFDGINTGCYSMDGKFKKSNRKVEKRLFMAEGILAMESLFLLKGTEVRVKSSLTKIWKTLLFNQFHDTLGGTAIKAARDEAIGQLMGAGAEAKRLWVLSLQRMVKALDTRGEGFPLFLFNPTGKAYRGPMEAEVNWFCKDELILKDPHGREISYQRVHTAAKVRNYNLGGRRGIVFEAQIPSFGFAVYRLFPCETKTQLCFDGRESSGGDVRVLENDFIRLEFDQEGYLCSLYEKGTGYEALKGRVSFPIWKDERDTWGSLQGRVFEETKEKLLFESCRMVEEGPLRKVLRLTYRLGASVLKQEYILYQNVRYVKVVNRLFWDREWHMLKINFPLNVQDNFVYAQTAYGTAMRHIADEAEYSMQRFLDVTEHGKEGLCIANDGKYAFSMQEDELSVPIARSAIFAQGNGKNWYNPLEGYEYADIGQQTFTLVLKPHGKALSVGERHRLAKAADPVLLYLADCCHDGVRMENCWSGLSIEEENVELGAVKPAEEGDGLIVRLVETGGYKAAGTLKIAGREVSYEIGVYEILSLNVGMDGSVRKVNLLEEDIL